MEIMLTIAFSNADRVMISRGRIFFSMRARMTFPVEAHSSRFSLDSAGNEDEPGIVMPNASAALAIVLAVYIFRRRIYELCHAREKFCTYAPASTRTRTGVSDGVIALLFSLCRLPVIQIFTIRLECRDDIQLLAVTRTGTYCSTVHHQTRAVQPSNCSAGNVRA